MCTVDFLQWTIRQCKPPWQTNHHNLNLWISNIKSKLSINTYLEYSLVPRPLPDFISQPWRKIRRRWDQNYVMDRKWWTWFVLIESTISGLWHSLIPGLLPIFLHGCEITSGRGLGTRLLRVPTKTIPNQFVQRHSHKVFWQLFTLVMGPFQSNSCIVVYRLLTGYGFTLTSKLMAQALSIIFSIQVFQNVGTTSPCL